MTIDKTTAISIKYDFDNGKMKHVSLSADGHGQITKEALDQCIEKLIWLLDKMQPESGATFVRVKKHPYPKGNPYLSAF